MNARPGARISGSHRQHTRRTAARPTGDAESVSLPASMKPVRHNLCSASNHMPLKSREGSDFHRLGNDAAELLTRGRAQGAIEPIPARGTDMHLLVLDEDEAVRRAIVEIATEMGFTVHAFRDTDAAEALLEQQSIDVILMDLRSSNGGLRLLERMHAHMPRIPIVVMTAFATVHSAVEAMRLGASDYLTKPFAMEELTATLKQVAQRREFDLESRRLREHLRHDQSLHGIVAQSAEMQKVLRMVSKVAFATHPVLLVGESGTGKETIAAAIHNGGLGRSGVSSLAEQVHGEGDAEAVPPFLPIDCSALSAAQLETELFGYVRAEGTAEREEHIGLLTRDGGGTLFVDAISDLPAELQSKLLRALQDRRVRPAGAAVARSVTVRVLAGSSRDLAALAESGAFRKDLHVRLTTVTLRLPPLRDRREDIPLLAEYFLQQFGKLRAVSMSLSPDASRALMLHRWPGNVRELEVAMERACSMSTGPIIQAVDLPSELQALLVVPAEGVRVDSRRTLDTPASALTEAARSEIQPLAVLEKQAILSAMRQLNGDKLKAAKMLGIGKTTLYRKLREYGID